MLDALDRQIIQLTQAGLPLCSEPYAEIAGRLRIEATEVMQRRRAMQTSGIIRRIGAVPNHYKLGYRFNGMSFRDMLDIRLKAKPATTGSIIKHIPGETEDRYQVFQDGAMVTYYASQIELLPATTSNIHELHAALWER